MKNINQSTAEFIDSILEIICLERGLSKNTKKAYKKDIGLVFEWFKKNNVNIFSANEKHFRELFFFLQSNNYKPSSLTRKLSALKQFYDVLKDESYIKINPLTVPIKPSVRHISLANQPVSYFVFNDGSASKLSLLSLESFQASRPQKTDTAPNNARIP